MEHHTAATGRARLLTALVAAAVLALMGACGGAPTVATGTGNVRTENRTVPSFDSVEFASAGTLTIAQTGSESVQVTADDGILPALTSEVQGATLKLGIKNATIPVDAKQISYRVTVGQLNGLTVSGAGQVTATGIDGSELTVTHGGASRVIVSGQVTRQVVDLTGVGEYDGAKLTSDDAEVTVSGAGSAVVDATRTLHAKVTGVGSIHYTGSPQVTKEISGVGEVGPQ